MSGWKALIGIVVLGVASPAAAQTNWSAWTLHSQGFGMEAHYRTRVSGDDMRVQWQCTNHTGERRACAITGQNRMKTYTCYDGLTNLGQTYGVAERASIRPNNTGEFISEQACGGMGATSLIVDAEVRFEEE